MNKEKIITIVIGLLFGAAIAGGYFYWTKVKVQTPSAKQAVDPKTTTTPNSNQAVSLLTITAPQDNSSTEEATVTLSGTAPASSRLVIYSNADEKVASASAQGKFEIPIKLEAGLNSISVTIIDTEGKIHTVNRNVTMEASQ